MPFTAQSQYAPTTAEKDAFFAVWRDLLALTKAYQEGERQHTLHLVQGLLKEYIDVGPVFATSRSKEHEGDSLLRQYDSDYS